MLKDDDCGSSAKQSGGSLEEERIKSFLLAWSSDSVSRQVINGINLDKLFRSNS
jgi:hypothetical protein